MKNNIKLIVTDLDGTLVDSSSKVILENKIVLKAFHDKGIKIAIATGRPFNAFWWIRQELGLESFDDYSICNTGAFVRCNADGKKIVDNSLTVEDFYKISSYLGDYDLQFALFSKDVLYNNAEVLNDGFLKDQSILLMPRQKYKTFEEIPSDIGRAAFLGDKDVLDSFYKDKKSEIEKDYMTMRNEDYALEVLKKTSGKEKSLKALCDYLGISTDEVMYFGDGANDKAAIELAGIGVAMGNASCDTKSVADYVGKTNDEAGLAKFLQEYFDIEV